VVICQAKSTILTFKLEKSVDLLVIMLTLLKQ